MAPSRRKGSSKAAAAAAACRQWKVGDLVLAKVKGFPAWPATVSEPEKWGYSRDRKKVLVYFFGTQQIAFCNPVDVEAFTEEKKQSLFVKRRGKGADFVRAVHEIVDCFEKLKSEEQNINSTDEVPVRSENMVVELNHTDMEGEAPTTRESSYSEHLGDESEPYFENGAGAVAAKEDASRDSEMMSVDPSSIVEVSHVPSAKTCSSRRKLEGGGSRNGAMERRAPSARRLRSSLRTEPEMLQNHVLHSCTYSKNAEHGANTVRDRSLRRSRRAGKPSDSLDMLHMEPNGFVCDGSMEESDSEIATVDSGSLSLNEGSSVESGSKAEHRCAAVQFESEVELCQRLEFKSNAVILKKKRKPSRKRLHSDVTESTAGIDKETAPETLTARASHLLPNDTVKSDERNSKELKDDGDEHLPLVKRARVRMGKSAPEGEVLDNEAQNEVKSPGTFDKSLEQIPEGDRSSVQNSTSINSDAYDSSPSKRCAAKIPPFWETRKQFCNSLDGESALPPSKRLHRALEAMSAYATDDDKKDMDGLCRMNTSINGSCSSYKEVCSELSEGIKLENGSDVARMGNMDELCRTNTSINGSCSSYKEVCSELSEGIKLERMGNMDGLCRMNTSINGSFSSYKEVCSELSEGIKLENGSDVARMGNMVCAAGEDATLFVPSAKELAAGEGLEHLSEVPDLTLTLARNEISEKVSCEDNRDILDAAVQTPQRMKSSDDCPSSTLVEHSADAKSDGELQHDLKCEHPSPGSVKSFDEKCENVVPESGKQFKDPNCEVSGKSADSESNDVVMTSSPGKVGIVQLHNADAECIDNNLCQGSVDRSNRDNEESISMKESGRATSSSSPEKVVVVSLKEMHLSSLSSVSDDQLGDKAVSTTLSSSSLTDGTESFARASTPNTLTCNVSTVDSSVRVSNACSSPLPQQLHDKPRVVGKLSSKGEANAALGSFEATLGTLTRTKESIGRATRLALDCAKFGVATKVVEIIARNLEKESSLHRRVDLFFLVDSIAQFSRGLKGPIGGIYASTIQGALPRLLLAAAPPGSSSQENRRQCLKVLRVWQERKILPESAIRPHIREFESFCGLSSSRAFSRRPLRAERSFDDPVREMEGMLVDEYGSNSSFQLPGFRMPPMLKDEEVSDSDGESFEAVTPEHPAGEQLNGEETVRVIEKRKHILEDVDGELEMEDVSPPMCQVEIASNSFCVGTNPVQISRSDDGKGFGAPFHPPLPTDGPPSVPPLPASPPPPPSSISNSTSGGVQSMFSEGSQNEGNLQDTVFQECTPPRNLPIVPNGIHCQTSDSREIHAEAPLRVPDSTSSFPCNGPVSHPPFGLSNGVQPPDGSSSKGFHLRPPHPAPSNQFSYVQADQRRDNTTHYSNVFHMQNADSRSFCRERNGMKSSRREIRECWMTPSHYPGPCYPDGTRGHYGGPYPAPHEPPPSHRLAYPPRGMNRREFFSHRPPPDHSIPVTSRGPGFWRPR